MDIESESETEPWDADPVDQLPPVIEPGRISLTLWSAPYWTDEMMAWDVEFSWTGGREAEWYQDISMSTGGLSVMSSAPTHGTATWENGRDLHLTYSSAELDLDGEDVLKGAAPTAGPPDSDEVMRSPQVWVKLAETVLGFVHGLM
ncbi:hypothetical protein [Gordonia hankookensis]|uniref:Activator of Hsp90 ATPase homolog 1-like protein n=1 Tax=Gordonia hankookensis TaxID=589403 RepID=A0ABR7WFD4_9ACTN|nr:hypothetical protein [Gordonia hankookensis]MBD1320582.1 hypothetical protein [Gordonia hankookensis]